jgi:hypothetical protein
MAIALGAAGTPATGTTTLAPVIPAGAAAGQVAVMCVEATISTDLITDATATGWTQRGSVKNNVSTTPFPTLTVLWKALQAGDPGASVTLTFTNTPDHCVGVINTYAGADTVTPFETDLFGHETTSVAAHTVGSITTALATDWILAAIGDRTASSWTPDAAFTERTDTAAAANANLETSDTNGTHAAGSVSGTFTGTATTSMAVWWIGALKVASAAAVTVFPSPFPQMRTEVVRGHPGARMIRA